MNLYYYTTSETLKYILKDGNIFATNMRYMNDAEEYTNGLRETWTLLREYPSPFRKAAQEVLTEKKYEEYCRGDVDSFSISFTQKRDLLSQWFMYAKESGVSVRMDFSKTRYLFLTYNKETEKKDVGYPGVTKPRPVYYFTKGAMAAADYGRCAKQILRDLEKQAAEQEIQDYQESIEKLWLGIVPYVKRFDFIAETEHRLVFDFSYEMDKRPRVDFRNDKSVLKPYLDIECNGGWPVREIIVGPGFNQDAVFQSLQYFLNNQEIKFVPLSDAVWKRMTAEYIKRMMDYDYPEPEVEKILAAWQKDNKGVAEVRYLEFQKFLKSLEQGSGETDKRLFRFMDSNYFSKDGILLSKSRIPYIY